MKLVESCWSQIDNGKNKKPIILGCIYRHPTYDLTEFTAPLNNIIKVLNPKYIFGYMNIVFLKINIHSPTEEYIDMLYTNGLLPAVTQL